MNMRRRLIALVILLFPVALVAGAAPALAATRVTQVQTVIIASKCRNFHSHSGSRDVRACVSLELKSSDLATVRARAWIGTQSGSGTIDKGCVKHLNLFVGTLTARHIDDTCKFPSGKRVTLYTSWWTHKYEVVHAGVFNICLYYTDGDYACTAIHDWFYSESHRLL